MRARAATATALAGAEQTSTLKTNSADTGIIISGAGVGVNNAGNDGVGEVGTVYVTNTTSAADSDTAILSGTLSIVGSDGVTHAITLGTANSTDTLTNLAATINSADYGVTATYNATVGTDGADIVLTSADSKSYRFPNQPGCSGSRSRHGSISHRHAVTHRAHRIPPLWPQSRA